jgi:hypothetical protein
MGFLINSCVLYSLNKNLLEQSKSFSCGDKDLDDFFIYQDKRIFIFNILLKKNYNLIKKLLTLPHNK